MKVEVEYFEGEFSACKVTPVPRHGLASDGYTLSSGAPTQYLVKIGQEKRWRRLYYWCFSNSGTHFLKIEGRSRVVRDSDVLLLREKTWGAKLNEEVYL